MERIHVTEAESAVLAPLWRLGPLTPARLVAEVKAARPWGEPTIKTLLARLKAKKAVRSERDGCVLRYRALLERPAYVEAEVRALVDRLFDREPRQLARFLAELEAR